MRASYPLFLAYLLNLSAAGRVFASNYIVLYTVLDQYDTCIGQLTQFYSREQLSDNTLAQLTAAIMPIANARNMTLSSNFTTDFCPPFGLGQDGVSVTLCTEDGYAWSNGYLDFYYLRNAFDYNQMLEVLTNATASFCVREYSIREKAVFGLIMLGLVLCCALDYRSRSGSHTSAPRRYETLDRQTAPSLFTQPGVATKDHHADATVAQGL